MVYNLLTSVMQVLDIGVLNGLHVLVYALCCTWFLGLVCKGGAARALLGGGVVWASGVW